jgi:hypothetical protein
MRSAKILGGRRSKSSAGYRNYEEAWIRAVFLS